MPDDVATCPECGATVKNEHAVEGTDAAVYPELSRANLLRMRGDFESASNQCLAILKRYPNNATAHSLLGDIWAERDDLVQAEQWYELALDLDPQSASVTQKLATVRERMRQKETAAGTSELGLPESPITQPWVYALAFAALVFVALIGYAIGQRRSSADGPKVINTPISAPYEDVVAPSVAAPAVPASVPVLRLPQADRALAAAVGRRSPYAANLLSLSIDPRSHIVTVTYTAEQDEERIGAELARTILEEYADAVIVTLRGVRNDRLVYMADAPRGRLQDIESGQYQGEWVTHLVTNVWTAPRVGPTAEGTAPVGATGG